ncbi:MAG: FAD binding domain-containing protein [Myxococcota bacterium]|jgi:CO/xanthine dehydrogenase FAD-binding subunit|nr:FAD binding domain-containing protein [Myxococcota bacterium]
MSSGVAWAPGGIPVLRPGSLLEACTLRQAHPGYGLIVDGAGLLPAPGAGVHLPDGVIDLRGVPELADLAISGPEVRLGATTTFATLQREPDLLAGWPLLGQAAAARGADQVRSQATLGGDLLYAAAAGDSLPPLAVYCARVELRSRRGTREVDLLDFYRKDGHDLAPDELLAAVRLPRPQPGTLQRFCKVGTGSAPAAAELAVALTLTRDQGDGTFQAVHLASHPLGPGVLRLTASEHLLEGQPLTPELLDRVAAQVAEEVQSAADGGVGARDRPGVAGEVVRRFLEELLP